LASKKHLRIRKRWKAGICHGRPRKQRQQCHEGYARNLGSGSCKIIFRSVFQPVGGDSISVVFSDDAIQNLASASWKGDPTASCRILSITRGKKRNSTMKGMGGMGQQKKKNAPLVSVVTLSTKQIKTLAIFNGQIIGLAYYSSSALLK